MPTAREKREAREQALRDEGAREALAKLNHQNFTDPGSIAAAAGPVARPQHAGAKVIVACKLGIAYFDIQLCQMDEKFQQNMQGGRMVKEATRTGSIVRLRGTAYPRGTLPEGFPERPVTIHNAALNYGVDRHFMEVWMEQNRLNPIVMNDMIMVDDNEDRLKARLKEVADKLSGLEPVNPKADHRMPKPINAAVSELESRPRTVTATDA
ncbi:peptidoglycan binding domain-containing protein [Bradyrhizobium sp.]